MAGHRVSSEDRRNSLSPAGRVCHEPDCPTVLSVYNDLDYCSLHQPMIVPRMRGKVLND